MKERFVPHKFQADAIELIDTMNNIIEEYEAQSLTLTLRQLYYQLVSRDVVPNTERSYKRIGGVLSDARLAGLVDWTAIEDRVRRPQIPGEWDEIEDIIRVAMRGFKLPRRKGQAIYVELWVEKDALAGVLEPLAYEFHCPLMVNRGYSSSSAMYAASKRFHEAFERDEGLAIVYVGDHDPSGEDMVRDVQERLRTFGVIVDVDKVALTMAQIRQYKPPPNPAKMSDSRAAKYVEEHGHQSWEVDALPPQVLQQIVRKALTVETDLDLMKKVKKDELTQKRRIAKKLGIGVVSEIEDD